MRLTTSALALLATPPLPRHAAITSSLVPGASVLLVGSGPVLLLAARLAAIKGFETTCAASPSDIAIGGQVCFDGLLSSDKINFVPLSGPDASDDKIAAAVAKSDGMIVAIDEDWTLTKPQLDEILPDASKADWPSHFVLMSRNLEVQQGGPFAFAAKRAANKELWEANEKSVDNYRAGEALIKQRALAAGAAWTVIRAGTMKGGASGDAGFTTDDGLTPSTGGEPSFLTGEFYKLGQQDTVNWRRIYDCGALGVELAAGDVLPGPGFTAALTATDKVGAGDSHRGAVATALVEALRCDAAKNRDFGVKAKEGREFPDAAAWARMFESA